MNAKLTHPTPTDAPTESPKAPYEVTVDGHELWVTPGSTPNGRYWQFTSASRVPAGTVTEHVEDGRTVYDALTTDMDGTLHWLNSQASLHAAARHIVAVLTAGAE